MIHFLRTTKVGAAILGVVIIILPLYFSTRYQASRHLESARTALASGNTEEAIDNLRRAISWSSPFNSAAQAATEEFFALLPSIADPKARLAAIWELRRGLISSRSFLAQRNDSSPEISALDDEVRKIVGDQAFKNQLREVIPPKVDYRYQILAQLAFWLWVSSTVWLVWVGVKPDGSIRASSCKLPALAVVMFFCLWLLSLSGA